MEWFKNLKPGDEVAYNRGKYGSIDYTITKVKKITPTGQVKTEDGLTFRNGECRVDRFTSYILEPATKEVKEIRRRKLMIKVIQKFMQDQDFLAIIETEELQSIYDIIRDCERRNR